MVSTVSGPHIVSNPEELMKILRDDYQNMRLLEDGTIVGTIELMFTRAICMGINHTGWEKRFCFESRSLALSELAKLKTFGDEPDGYIARRGLGAQEWYDSKPKDWITPSSGA